MRAPPYSLAFVLAALSATAGAQRPDETGSEALFRFDDSDVVESYDGTSVRVFYTRGGSNAVPSADSDLSGVPDYVELSAATYDEALMFYNELGFRAPLGDDDLGGDARFDVYLVDFFGSADGSFQTDLCPDERCSGYMVQENDFAGYGYSTLEEAVRTIASHELFHAVQAAYTSGQSAVFSEGGATWATEMFDESLSDFERAIRGYLRDPERPLSSGSSTVVDPFAYGAALWYQFIYERFGVAIVLDLLEGSEHADWLEVLASEFEARGSSFEDEFLLFAEWGLRLDSATGFEAGEEYSTLSAREGTLAFDDERPRHFANAMRVYDLDPDGQTRVVAAISEPSEAGALTLMMVPRGADGPQVERLVRGESRVEMDLEPGEWALLAVVNPAIDGASERSSLCVGSAAEVDDCLMRFAPDAGVQDAGVSDAGDGSDAAIQDAGVQDARITPDASMGSDAGMTAAPASGCSVGHAPAMPWTLLFAGFVWRRGRTRARRLRRSALTTP